MPDEERVTRIKGYVEAISWFLKHPEALSDETLRAFVEHIRSLLEEAESKEQGTQKALAVQ